MGALVVLLQEAGGLETLRSLVNLEYPLRQPISPSGDAPAPVTATDASPAVLPSDYRLEAIPQAVRVW